MLWETHLREEFLAFYKKAFQRGRQTGRHITTRTAVPHMTKIKINPPGGSTKLYRI